jgi:hypothetical protein
LETNSTSSEDDKVVPEGQADGAARDKFDSLFVSAKMNHSLTEGMARKRRGGETSFFEV